MAVALKRAIVESPYTFEEVAGLIGGISYDQLNNMANGRTKVKDDVLKSVKKLLNLPPAWPHMEQPLSVAGTPLAPVQVVGAVAAGYDAYTVDPDEHTIFVPETLANLGGLGWVVDGDSMMPDLKPGMVAIFKEHRSPLEGLTFLVQGKDGGLRVKTLDWRSNAWHLVSTNPAYPAEFLGEYALLGYLIGWYQVRGKRETLDSDPDGLRLHTW